MDDFSIKTHLKERLRRIKSISRGAMVSLLDDGNGFTAYLEDAQTVAQITGLPLKDLGDIFDTIPTLTIPYDQVDREVKKAVGIASVALVTMAADLREGTTKYECFYVQQKGAPSFAPRPAPVATMEQIEDLLAGLDGDPEDEDLLNGL